MKSELKDLKSFETQEEYESALVHRAFVREQIALSKDRILGLTEEIANEWSYVSNYKMILEDLTRHEQEIPHFYKWWDEL